MSPGLGQCSLHSTRIFRPSQSRGRLASVPRRLGSTFVPHPPSPVSCGSGSPHTSGPRPWPAQVTSCLRLPRITHPSPRAPRASQIHPLDPHLSQFPEKPLGFRSRPRQSGLHRSHPTAGSPRLAVEQPPACLWLRGPRNSDTERAWKAAGAPELSQPSTLTLLADPPSSSFPASCLSPH